VGELAPKALAISQDFIAGACDFAPSGLVFTRASYPFHLAADFSCPMAPEQLGIDPAIENTTSHSYYDLRLSLHHYRAYRRNEAVTLPRPEQLWKKEKTKEKRKHPDHLLVSRIDASSVSKSWLYDPRPA